MSLRSLFFAGSLGLATILGSNSITHAQEPVSEPRRHQLDAVDPMPASVDNQQMADAIAAALRKHPEIRQYRIDVGYVAGVAELHGHVADSTQRDLVRQTVLSVPGVAQVRDPASQQVSGSKNRCRSFPRRRGRPSRRRRRCACRERIRPRRWRRCRFRRLRPGAECRRSRCRSSGVRRASACIRIRSTSSRRCRRMRGRRMPLTTTTRGWLSRISTNLLITTSSRSSEPDVPVSEDSARMAARHARMAGRQLVVWA